MTDTKKTQALWFAFMLACVATFIAAVYAYPVQTALISLGVTVLSLVWLTLWLLWIVIGDAVEARAARKRYEDRIKEHERALYEHRTGR